MISIINTIFKLIPFDGKKTVIVSAILAFNEFLKIIGPLLPETIQLFLAPIINFIDTFIAPLLIGTVGHKVVKKANGE